MWVLQAVIYVCVSSGNECSQVGPRFTVTARIILLYIHSLSEPEITALTERYIKKKTG